MRAADLSLTVRQRKLACVLDPALALGHALGPTLALRLAQVFEPWLTRSFWQTLDASELLLRRIERGMVPGAALRLDPDALMSWMTLRDSTDAGSWTLHWVDENFSLSQVGDAADSDLVDRYELLAAALDERIEGRDAHWSPGLDPVRSAMDTVALSACLQGALVLSEMPEGDAPAPWPVQALQRAHLPADRLEPLQGSTLFHAERELVRESLVAAGLAAIAQRLPAMAAVHVIVDESSAGGDEAGADPWRGAHAWWYVL